jgi:hypothetical protein
LVSSSSTLSLSSATALVGVFVFKAKPVVGVAFPPEATLGRGLAGASDARGLTAAVEVPALAVAAAGFFAKVASFGDATLAAVVVPAVCLVETTRDGFAAVE